MYGLIQTGTTVAAAVLPEVTAGTVHSITTLCNPFAAAIGLLYLVLSAAACEHGCGAIRRTIHHYERSIERLIGSIYLAYSIQWSALVEVLQ